jgi:hypothetical protein
MERLNVSPVVSGCERLAMLRRDILRYGNGTLPDGLKITSVPNAEAATGRTRANSGNLADVLINSSPDGQRRLWPILRRQAETKSLNSKLQSLTTPQNSNTSNEPSDSIGHEHLEKAEALSKRRKALFIQYAYETDKTRRTNAYQQINELNHQLYALTGNEMYIHF